MQDNASDLGHCGSALAKLHNLKIFLWNSSFSRKDPTLSYSSKSCFSFYKFFIQKWQKKYYTLH